MALGGSPVPRLGNCPTHRLWSYLVEVIKSGVIASFLTPCQNGCIKFFAKFGPQLDRHRSAIAIFSALLRRVNSARKAKLVSRLGFNSSSNSAYAHFSASHLHTEVLSLVTGDSVHSEFLSLATGNAVPSPLSNVVAISSGGFSIFPETLRSPILLIPPPVEYVLAEGQFHDGRNYYSRLITEKMLQPSGCSTPKTSISSFLPGSCIGGHSELIMTIKGNGNEMVLRTTVRISSRVMEVDFMRIQRKYLLLCYTTACSHPRETPLDKDKRLIPTSVEAPWVESDSICITQTHGNAEAQFICCHYVAYTVPVLVIVQTNCCINCAYNQAKKRGFRLIIQT